MGWKLWWCWWWWLTAAAVEVAAESEHHHLVTRIGFGSCANQRAPQVTSLPPLIPSFSLLRNDRSIM